MIEPKVTSLELSKRLKEAGYPQKGNWWWVNAYSALTNTREWFLSSFKDEDDKVNPQIVAPTVVELGEGLPTIEKVLQKVSSDETWEVVLKNTKWYWNPDCLAKMWLCLKEKG